MQLLGRSQSITGVILPGLALAGSLGETGRSVDTATTCAQSTPTFCRLANERVVYVRFGTAVHGHQTELSIPLCCVCNVSLRRLPMG
jgi:hypothetical protein